ncbi:MAG: hypothetical protein AAFY85_01455 [Pseudomonadota bacterium]
MADGQPHGGGEDFDVIDPASLDEIIRQIEAGQPVPGYGIDLGGGCIARADGPGGERGLLQRLKGHRLLLRIAASGTVLEPGEETPAVMPEVKSLLDAVRKAG